MKKRVLTKSRDSTRRLKNPVGVADEPVHPVPRLTPLAKVPGVRAILERAKTPYRKNPLREDEALNLICDARKNEPALLIGRLLNKYKHDLGD